MVPGIDTDKFIRTYVTKRQTSLLKEDLESNNSLLEERLGGKRVLVIGGAGTIGSYYIKALLKFKKMPARRRFDPKPEEA